MDFSLTTSRSIYRLRISLLISLLVLMPLFTGCGEKGILIEGTLATETSASTTTDGDDSDDYSDVFVPDPDDSRTRDVSFTIGLNKVVLQSTADPSLNFIIFDTGVDDPFTVTIPYTSPNNPLFGTSANDPINGDYDQIQYEVTFFELRLPNNNRRVRLSLADTASACQNDIQIDLEFLDQTTGQPKTLTDSRDCSNENEVYQLPSEQLTVPGSPTNTDNPYLFTLPLPKTISIKDDTDTKTTITLEFGINNIFFFDDTEGDDGNGFFDPFSTCPVQSCDGRLSSANTPTGGDGSADFWLGFPTVTVKVE